MSAEAMAATRTVDDSGGADFTTIQAAIAASASGDTVSVYPGTYVENLDFLGRSIVLQSTAGAASTFVRATSSGFFTVTMTSTVTSSARIVGFTLGGSNRVLSVVGATP